MTEEICYICRRTESKAGKMLHLPPNITICNDCMQKTLNAFNTSPMSDYLNMGGFTPDMIKRRERRFPLLLPVKMKIVNQKRKIKRKVEGKTHRYSALDSFLRCFRDRVT